MKAFPRTTKMWKNSNEDSYEIVSDEGMDLRDYFAAKAMQGFCSEGTMFSTKEGEFQSDACAKAAYEWADAMMEVRGK